ncbi:MAG TPA: hypothetical protein VFB79_00435 [Candidatus Angelobacter sp.]|nr:hypothetical protein [Candidatus Angelobacter sp.]
MLEFTRQIEEVHQLVNARRKKLGQPLVDFSIRKPRRNRVRDWKHRRQLFAELCPDLAARIAAAGTVSELAGRLNVRPCLIRMFINGSVPTVGLARAFFLLLNIAPPAELQQLDFSGLKNLRKRKRISLRDLAPVFDAKTHVILFLEQGKVDKVDVITAVEVARWMREHE